MHGVDVRIQERSYNFILLNCIPRYYLKITQMGGGETLLLRHCTTPSNGDGRTNEH